MSVLIFLLAWTVLSLPLGILIGKAIAEMDGRVRYPVTGKSARRNSRNDLGLLIVRDRLGRKSG